MNAARCPRCGGLVTADAEWCGQCLAPLPGSPGADDRATERQETERKEPVPAGPAPDVQEAPAPAEGPPREGGPPVRRVGDRLVWTCPTCQFENALEARACERCGTAFGDLFPEPGRRPDITPNRASTLSLIFPGVGHVAAGRTGEGVARGVLFLWTLGSGLAILLARTDGGLGSMGILVSLYILAAAILYGVSVVDAGRAVEDRPPVLSWRILLFGVSGLVLVTLAMFVASGFGAAGAGGPGG